MKREEFLQSNLYILDKIKIIKDQIKDSTISIDRNYRREVEYIHDYIDKYIFLIKKQNRLKDKNERINILEENIAVLNTIKWYVDYLQEKVKISDRAYISIGKNLEDLVKMTISLKNYIDGAKR